MEEIKTAAPAQEPPKKVRRVGTVAFSLLLIASGFLLIAQQFLPNFDLLYVFRFADFAGHRGADLRYQHQGTDEI